MQTSLIALELGLTLNSAFGLKPVMPGGQGGCTHHDSVDGHILRDVAEMRCGKVIRSQEKVGGWPELR